MSVKKGRSERFTMRAVSPCRGKLVVIFLKASLLKGRYSKMAGLCVFLGSSARLPSLDQGVSPIPL